MKHHAVQLDGFLTLARFPLDRPAGESPIVLQGVRSAELEEKLRLKAMEMGLKVSPVRFVIWVFQPAPSDFTCPPNFNIAFSKNAAFYIIPLK